MFKTRAKGGRNVVDISSERKYRERFNCLGVFCRDNVSLTRRQAVVLWKRTDISRKFPFFSVSPSIIEDLSQAEQLATYINMPRLAGKNGNCDYNNRSALSIYSDVWTAKSERRKVTNADFTLIS